MNVFFKRIAIMGDSTFINKVYMERSQGNARVPWVYVCFKAANNPF